MVGEGDRLEAEGLRPVDELVELRGAVEKAVLRVNVEVNEVGRQRATYSHSIVAGGFDEMS